MRSGRSLARHYSLLLGGGFLLFGGLMLLLVVQLIMLPMARRAADDLAALMVLSAQTWRELPPHTRPDFARELLERHQLAVRPGPMEETADEHWHGFYFLFLEQALGARVGEPVQMAMAPGPEGTWGWANLPVGGARLAVGLPHGRVATHPLWLLLLAPLVALGLGVGIARLLARRIAAPLESLERAMEVVGRGATPAPIPERGPRELAAVAHHFNQTAAQVRELLAARTTLFAGLSHDLRTPLARLRLAAEMYVAQPAPALLRRIEDEVEHLDRLIGDLLALSRGIAEEPAESLDLAAVLAELAGQAAGTACPPVRVTCPPLIVRVAPTALRRVLGNLLDNALRHGRGPVGLSASASAGRVTVSVEDCGPGIAPAAQEGVFRPFSRGEGSRSSSTGGTGLGLAIVHQLCALYGWRIELANRPGGGFAASVSMPGAARSE